MFWQVYPRDIYAFGLVAWTGNDVLNRRYMLASFYSELSIIIVPERDWISFFKNNF